jgi:hypothetical protein
MSSGQLNPTCSKPLNLYKLSKKSHEFSKVKMWIYIRENIMPLFLRLNIFEMDL